MTSLVTGTRSTQWTGAPTVRGSSVAAKTNCSEYGDTNFLRLFSEMSKKGTIDKKDEIASLYKDLASLRATEDFEPGQEDYEKAVKVGLYTFLCSLNIIRLFYQYVYFSNDDLNLDLSAYIPFGRCVAVDLTCAPFSTAGIEQLSQAAIVESKAQAPSALGVSDGYGEAGPPLPSPGIGPS